MQETLPTRDPSEHERSHRSRTDDESLIRLSSEGCPECFALLFHRYCKLVFAIAWKVLRQKSDAEDVVQEVFLTIFMQANPYDASRGSVRTWIANFAQYKALIKRRYLNSRRQTSLEELHLFELGLSNSVVSNVIERAAFVEQSLGLLDARQRRTIELIHFDGYTLAETANLLKETLANTRNQYYRGMKALRQQLKTARNGDGVVNSKTQGSHAQETSGSLALNTSTPFPFPGV